MIIATKTTKSKSSKQSLPGTNSQKGTKQCACCKKEKKMTDFYISKSPLFALDERVPFCKDCILDSSLNEDGTINEIELNKTLKKIDRPYYKDLIQSSINGFLNENSYIKEEEVDKFGREILKRYFRLIAMRQDRAKSYEDSERDGFMHPTSNTPISVKEKIAQKYSDINSEKIDDKNLLNEQIIIDDDFEVTPEIIELFGEGYKKNEYRNMFKKYEKLKFNYTLQTNIHQEALATYVRFKVKEEDATARGDVTEAKKWYDAAQDAAEKGKLTPRQLTKADLDSGVNSISEMVKAVEQAVDVIKILPRFKYRPNDAPDFNIWCYVNYERNLNDQPLVDYEDIYAFYDKRKEEYLKQNGDPYGIFKGDTAQKNRESVKTFIKLPDDYDELAGDSAND